MSIREVEKMSNCLEVIGKNIYTARVEKGFSICDLSEKTGISEKYLKAIEAGKAKGVLLSHIAFIANGLNCKMSDLLSKS